MKASPNREQQLFLVTGGVILFLILAVVIFNMIRTPERVSEEKIPPRPVVQFPVPDGQGKVGDENSAWKLPTVIDSDRNEPSPPAGESILFTPKAIKTPQEVGQNWEPLGKTKELLTSGSEEEKTSPSAGPKDKQDEATLWHREPAALESARLEAQDRPGGLAPAKVTPTPSAPKEPTAKVTPSPSAPKVSPAPKEPPASKEILAKKQAPPPVQAKTKPAETDYTQAITQAIARQQPSSAKTAASPPPAAVALAQPKTSASGYTIQIASFSSAENATALANRVGSLMYEGRRMPAFRSSVSVGDKTYHRVRAGPFSSQDKASAALQFLKAKAGLQGSIIAPGS